MPRADIILPYCLVLSLLVSPALAQPAMPNMVSHDPAPAPGGAADRAMMTAMDRMSKAMNTAPMRGDPDHDFVAMMIPHHQGAIDMAEAELRYGKDKALLKLSRDIVAAQAKEIAMMRKWQTDNPQSR